MNKGPSRNPVGDPRGSDFVRDQRRHWTWNGYACEGYTTVWGDEQVLIVEPSSAGRFFPMNFAKKHRRAQKCLSAVKSIERGLRAIS